MIDEYRKKRRKFGLLLLAAVAAGLILTSCGLTVAGCAVFGGAMFAFGAPFIYYNELVRRAPEEPPKPAKPGGQLIFIAPLSAGLGKSSLYFDPAGYQCVIKYAGSEHTKTVSPIRAGEMLCENGNYFGALKLGKAANINFGSTVNEYARANRVVRMETGRLPAEGEERSRLTQFGQLTEVYRNGAWVPVPERCKIHEGMDDHFTAFRIQQAQLADVPKPARPDRAWYDRSMDKYRWTVPLEDSRTYFLSMFFGGDKKFLHYSLDVELASDSHYEFTLGGEDNIRPILAGPDAGVTAHTKLLHELMADFLKVNRGSLLVEIVEKNCTAQFHYD